MPKSCLSLDTLTLHAEDGLTRLLVAPRLEAVSEVRLKLSVSNAVWVGSAHVIEVKALSVRVARLEVRAGEMGLLGGCQLLH